MPSVHINMAWQQTASEIFIGYDFGKLFEVVLRDASVLKTRFFFLEVIFKENFFILENAALSPFFEHVIHDRILRAQANPLSACFKIILLGY